MNAIQSEKEGESEGRRVLYCIVHVGKGEGKLREDSGSCRGDRRGTRWETREGSYGRIVVI